MKHSTGNDDPLQILQSNLICYRCIGEPYLKKEVQSLGQPGTCSYCGGTDHSYSLIDLAERIEQAFEEHFVRSPEQPNAWEWAMTKDPELTYAWLRDGEPTVYAIMNAAEVGERAAHDLQRILEEQHFDLEAAKMGEETEFAADAHYVERSPSHEQWLDEWTSFERELRSRVRFFSQSGVRLLDSVFEGVAMMHSWEGEPLISPAGPDSILSSVYRARVFQSTELLKEALARPDRHLGPPPSHLARAGRMNARGIPVFYGADRADVALAEVRPPVGSHVALACFDIIRPLRLLNLDALQRVRTPGSIFDRTYIKRLEKEMFLRTLTERMTRPVMPDDEEFEYLVTQATADYLANHPELQLDGILFPSAQAREGRNVILFHKAAAVEDLEIPEGTKFDVRLGYHTDDGWEDDFHVVEEVRREPADEEKDLVLRRIDVLLTELPQSPWYEDRQVTLRLDTGSIAVHRVSAVRVDADQFPVSRTRFDPGHEDF